MERCPRRGPVRVAVVLAGALTAGLLLAGPAAALPPPGGGGGGGGGGGDGPTALETRPGPAPAGDAEPGTYWSAAEADATGTRYAIRNPVAGYANCTDSGLSTVADATLGMQLSNDTIWPRPNQPYALRLTYVPRVTDVPSCPFHTVVPTFNLGGATGWQPQAAGAPLRPVPRCYQGNSTQNRWVPQPCHAEPVDNTTHGARWGEAWKVVLDVPGTAALPAFTDGNSSWQVYLPVHAASLSGWTRPVFCGIVCQYVGTDFTAGNSRYRVDLDVSGRTWRATSVWQLQQVHPTAAAADVVAAHNGLPALGAPRTISYSTQIGALNRPLDPGQLTLFRRTAAVVSMTGRGTIVPGDLANLWFADLLGTSPRPLGYPVSEWRFNAQGFLAQDFQSGSVSGTPTPTGLAYTVCPTGLACRLVRPLPVPLPPS